MKLIYKYCLIVLLCLLGGLVTRIYAQQNLTVSGRVVKKGSGDVYPYVHVYVFKTNEIGPAKDQAEAAKKQYNTFDKETGREYFWKEYLDIVHKIPYRPTISGEDGRYTLENVPENAYLMFIPYQGDAEIMPVDSKFELPDIEVQADRVLKTVYVTGQLKDSPPNPINCGRNISINQDIYINRSDLNSNVRLVIFPYYVECSLNEDGNFTDTTFLQPIVSYGSQYRHTQDRRMDFDLERDSLFRYYKNNYYKDSLNLKDLSQSLDSFSRMKLFFNIIVPDAKKKYIAKALIKYEDYNGIFSEREVLLKPCEDNKPMKFLEYNFGSGVLNPADPYFRVIPEIKKHDAVGDINLTFIRGKAELDPNNPDNELEMNRLRDELISIESNNSGHLLRSLKIIGKSSPDGSYERNYSLAGDRISYALKELTTGMNQYTLRRLELTKTPIVAGWDELADSLANDSLFEEAEEVRRIVEKHKGNHTLQSQVMKNVSFYKMLEDKYFPKLRSVKYQYTYETMRALTDQEILQKYKENKHLPPNKTFFTYYEYWRLANIVKEDSLLRDVYSRYYAYTKKEKIKDELAACNYAAFCIKDKICDTLILKPYVTNYIKKTDHIVEDDISGKDIVYNRSEIIRNQALMYMLAEDYTKARGLCEKLPMSDEKEELMAFVKCLDCGYDEEGVAEIVAKSSDINKIVIALAKEEYDILPFVEERLSDKEPLKHYFLAQIKTKTQIPDPKDTVIPNHLLECFKLDEKYLDIARGDAVFLNPITNEKPGFDMAEEMYLKWKEQNKKNNK